MIPYSQFNFPWSGDVVQRIDPDVYFGAIPAEAGDGQIEKAIVQKSSYGRQLGLITEVLVDLVDEISPGMQGHESLKKLKKIQIAIEQIKKEMKATTRETTRRLLEKMRQSDPEAFKQILQDFSPHA